MEFLYGSHHNDVMINNLSKNKILICIDSNPFMSVLLQKAVEAAEVYKCPIDAIYVETSRHYKLDEKQILQLKKNLKKVESLGINVHRVTGASIAQTILQFSLENKFNKIFIGASLKGAFVSIVKPSLHRELVRNKYNIEINTLPLPKKKKKNLEHFRILSERQNLIGYLVSAIVISSITLVGRVLDYNSEFIGYHPSLYNQSMILLLGVLFCAVRYGFLPGLFSALFGFSALNLFFIKPILQFSIDDTSEYVSLIIFLIAGVISSSFGGFSKQQIRNLRLRETQSQAAIRLNEIVSNINDEDKALDLLQSELFNIANTKTILVLLDEEKNIRKQSSDLTGFSHDDRKSLKIVIESEESYKVNILNKGNFHFEPIFSDDDLIGILAIEETKEMARHMPKLYESLAKQCGLVLHKLTLANEIETSKIREEREQLRSALLSSVSHDLKTPLASIIGSLSAVKQMGDKLDKESSNELILTALEEAERLNGFISNILDMTKLESKAVELSQDWFSFEEMVNQVLKTLRFRAKSHTVSFSKPQQDISLHVDRMLFAQVLQNIIDNAIKYSPKESEVNISLKINDMDEVEISIADEGAGIPDEDKSKVFDKFTRLKMKDHTVAGTGLGLAICKIIIDQHSGGILIEDNPEAENKGTIFKIKLTNYRVNET